MNVYTLAEVAQVLRVTEEEVIQLVRQGKLAAFPVLEHARIKEEALTDFMNTPYPGSPNRAVRGRSAGVGAAGDRKRNRNPQLEAAGREWVWEQIRAVAPDLSIRSRTEFTANGKQGVLRVSTTPSGPREEYWFGFPERLFNSDLPLFILPLLADRQMVFVVPYARHKRGFDGLSRAAPGRKLFNIMERTGDYYLTGKGIEQPLPLDPYVNAFDLLR